jgi:16S rRNA (cytosine1402-N4)-methyltransferase
MNRTEQMHQSVLLNEVIDMLAPVDGETYIDGTLGMGGHTEAILQKCKPTGRVIGFEWDRDALQLARERLEKYGDRITTIHASYAEIQKYLQPDSIQKPDGLLLDLGLSSFQLDASGRGFTFRKSEPLDMRMDERTTTTAANLLKNSSEEELADIFYYLGDERQARRIASFIKTEQKKEAITTTDRLADIIERAVPKRFHPKKIHVATRVFQALRIAVNRELDNITRILDCAAGLLKPGARICVISFHSLEDRLVKRKLSSNPFLDVLTRKPITPGPEECRTNPRARSAKLRVAAVAAQAV